ncbi:MAG: c-type cytochrome [Proteobacteria bacterium]|nr:c-type cytochrome [Pseudomonadota bacterium]
MTHWQRVATTAVLVPLLASVCATAEAQARKKPAASAASAASAATAPAGAAVYAERFKTVCAACHGADGRSDMAGVPVLAGQPSLYVITQLFLFREGRRNNEAMIAMAKPMKDDDLRGFSDYIGTLPAVPAPPPATPPDASRMSKGQALAQQHKCVYCHGADLAGGQQVPLIGGQKEDYVRAALHGFKSGDRPAYTRAMTEALSQVPVEDLDVLAYYVANFTGK